MKRHGMKGQPASHGQTKTHRKMGATGGGQVREMVTWMQGAHCVCVCVCVCDRILVVYGRGRGCQGGWEEYVSQLQV